MGGRFAVQTLSLDQPGTRRGVGERPSKVPSGLGISVGLFLPAASPLATASPPEPDVAHDHIGLRQHQILAVTCIGVRFARHVKHPGLASAARPWAARQAAVSSVRVGARPR